MELRPLFFGDHAAALERGRAFYRAMNTARKKNPSLSASESPDGKAKEWPLYDLENKQLMIFDEFNIHPEKESQRKILDWDRTYFLTKYYCL